MEGTHQVVLGDFNLHHPYWGGVGQLTQHKAADNLIDIASNHGLALVTPRGTTTWRARGSQSTIDLIFLSQQIETRMTKCIPRLDLAQSSDHIPMELTLDIRPQHYVPPRRRCWKKLDIERLQRALDGKVLDTPLSTNQ